MIIIKDLTWSTCQKKAFKTSRQCGRTRPLSPGFRRTGALGTAVVEGVDKLTVDERNFDEWTLDEWTVDEGSVDEGSVAEGTADEGTADEGTVDEWTADEWTVGLAGGDFVLDEGATVEVEFVLGPLPLLMAFFTAAS